MSNDDNRVTVCRFCGSESCDGVLLTCRGCGVRMCTGEAEKTLKENPGYRAANNQHIVIRGMGQVWPCGPLV